MFRVTRQLRKLRRAASPAPEFKTALLTRIVGESLPERRPLFRFVTAGIAALVLFFGMGTGVYAYESPDVVDGHPLYFVKQNMERIEERLATTPEARAEFHAKMMDRRISEAEQVSREHEKIAPILQAAADELDLSVEELRNDLKDPARRQAVIDGLAEKNERYADVVKRVPIAEESRRPFPRPEAMRERLQSLRQDSFETP